MAVVIPVHNEEQHLERALAGVRTAADLLQQHHPAVGVSIVVVLDGCTDNSASVAAGFAKADSRCTLVEVAFRSVGKSRRAGIRALFTGDAGTRVRVAAEQLWLANTDADSHVPANWLLRQLELGLWLSAMAGFTTWATDSFALVFGLRFGRHRFAPRISPKKSWEGALGGGAVGVLVGTTWGYFTLPSIPLYHVFSLALVIVVGGMLGDLAESLIKRQVGAKDAGGLIPGHGGVLDRIDSMMFAFPLTALYAAWILQLK